MDILTCVYIIRLPNAIVCTEFHWQVISFEPSTFIFQQICFPARNITGDFFEEWNEITPQTHIRKFEEQRALVRVPCWE